MLKHATWLGKFLFLTDVGVVPRPPGWDTRQFYLAKTGDVVVCSADLNRTYFCGGSNLRCMGFVKTSSSLRGWVWTGQDQGAMHPVFAP